MKATYKATYMTVLLCPFSLLPHADLPVIHTPDLQARRYSDEGPSLDMETEYQIKHLADPSRSRKSYPKQSYHPQEPLMDAASPCQENFLQVGTLLLPSAVL
jgi:hypothetical protein